MCAAGAAPGGLPGQEHDHAAEEAEALPEELEQRAQELFTKLMCWCESENWTRTLAGCAEPCAAPQKRLVRQWLRAGLSDSEIIERMVQEAVRVRGPSGVKVVASPKSLPLLAPFVILAVAAAIVFAVLKRLVRPQERRQDDRAQDEESKDPEYARFEAQLERELSQLED